MRLQKRSLVARLDKLTGMLATARLIAELLSHEAKDPTDRDDLVSIAKDLGDMIDDIAVVRRSMGELKL